MGERDGGGQSGGAKAEDGGLGNGAPPPLDQVVAAIHAMHSMQATDRDNATIWLRFLQKSIHSWSIADQLLQRKLDMQSCYFAAQTMKSKIQHSFFELPQESHASLRDSLLEHVGGITPATDQAIVTQLCLALADLALQMTSWNNPVEDLMKKFASTNVWALLEIITVIPEEVLSSTMRLGENRREELKQYLMCNSVIISEFLKQTLTNSDRNGQVSIKIIKCLTSWIFIKAINLTDITDNIVLNHAFHILGDHTSCPDLHDTATECICALLQCLEENNNSENIEQVVFNSILLLEKSYHHAVAMEDQEKAMNYSRIFTELGESFLLKVVNHSNPTGTNHFAIKSLDLVLICVGHHDYEVAEISFNLWYRLSEELYKKDVEQLTSIFKPYIERLISALCRHCQMEPDHQGLLNKDDEFYDFRQKVSELIKDVIFIIGSGHCFKQFFFSIQGQDVSWERTEAALYVMQAVAKNTLPEEYEVVPKVVEAILSMPDTAHVAVRHTSTLLLGELCEWIEKHPECIPATLEFLLRALQNAALACVAAHALQNICSTCRGHMHVHLSGLLQIVQSLDSFPLSTYAAIDLLKGVASIIGYLPPEQVINVMKEACAVQITALMAINNHTVNVNKGTLSDPTIWLDRLAALFRYCKLTVEPGQSHPCVPILVEIWPVLSLTMDKYNSDPRIMEKLCRCLRFAIRFLGKHGSILFDPLAKQMVTIYVTHRHSCFLYLASILVDEFAEDQNCTEGLMEMLQALIIPTFDLLQNSGLAEYPDTVDDLFRLCVRFLQRITLRFLQSPALDAIIQCAIMACALDQRDANTSVMKFLADFVHIAQSQHRDAQQYATLVGAKLAQHGEQLLSNLVQSSLFCLHNYMLQDVATVLYELLKWNRSLVTNWMEGVLRSIPQRNACATPAQILHFHQVFSKADTEKHVHEAVRDFVKLYH